MTAVTATLDGNAANESYGYNTNGNRTMTGYSTGGDNALTSSPGYTYTYDNEGNMTAKTQTSTGDVWTYTYDDRNRLTGVLEKSSGGTTLNQATYTYDALDRRIGMDDNGTKLWTVFDGQNPTPTLLAPALWQLGICQGPQSTNSSPGLLRRARPPGI